MKVKKHLTFKFMHFGDTHLGRKHPNSLKKVRVETGIRAFEHCIQKAVDEDVDFIIHAGDFFDRVYPWHSVIEAARQKMKPLEENEIPMYVIRGNHDRSFGQDRVLKGIAIEHLENEFVHLLDPQPEEFGSEPVNESGATIHGLGYQSDSASGILKQFEPEGDFNLLIMHDFVDGVTRKFSENVPRADDIASSGWDYVAIGHDHQPVPKKEVDGTVFAATGGITDYDYNREEFGKFLNIVTVDDGKIDIDSQKIPQELELRMVDADDREQLLRKIQELEPDGRIAVKAKMTDGDIKTAELEEEVEESIEYLEQLDIILEISQEELEEYDTETEEFNVASYLDSALEQPERFKQLHREAEELMRNEENMTSSGFNLRKDSREDLRDRVEEVLFE